MLIDSPRLTDRDRAAWAERERYDARLAASPRLAAMADRARSVICNFAAAGACYVSTSWGKDSTVLAHLAATCGVVLPLVHVRMRVWENPDCLTVRDAFLDSYADRVDYHEYFVDGGLRWWDVGELRPRASHVGGQFDEAKRHHGERHISGVRAEESRVRRIAMGRWGEAGPGAARPIGRWTAVDVFAYLYRYGLPVHPAYAMSEGGAHDRRWLRVSPIGGISMADGLRASWEARYYPDLVPARARGGTGERG